MDKHFRGTVDFLNVVRFGIAMAAEAPGRVHSDRGLGRLFEQARPMLETRRR